MKITTASATETDAVKAANLVVEATKRQLGGVRPDLVMYFLSAYGASQFEAAAAAIASGLEAPHIIGCAAESVIGDDVEYEFVPAVSLWAAHLPEAEVTTAHLEMEQTADGYAFVGTPDLPQVPASMVLLGDPYSFPAHTYVAQLGEDHPQLQVLGGMASGAQKPGESALFLGSRVLASGAVAAVISGGVRVRPVVSQGCRPFGRHLVVTKSDRNVILELGGRPAIAKLKEQIDDMSPADRALLERGLHLGIAVDARKGQYQRGDFLVRNVMGFSRETGAVVVTDIVRPGSTVQFHVRDAATASEDLELLLREARSAGGRPRGALLFSCNGRGRRLFQALNHDAGLTSRTFEGIPIAGFFAAGEIGPVGGQNFMHGFTASLALFEEAP